MGGGLEQENDPGYTPNIAKQTNLDQQVPIGPPPPAAPIQPAAAPLGPVATPGYAPSPAVVYVPVQGGAGGGPRAGGAREQRRKMSDMMLIWWMVFFICFCPLSLVVLPCFLESYREMEDVPTQTAPGLGNGNVVVVQHPPTMTEAPVDLEKGVYEQSTRVS